MAAGAKRSKKSPVVEEALLTEVKDELAGQPTTARRWVRRSLRWLEERISQTAGVIKRTTVRRLLKKHKIGLVSNRKSLSGPPHPDRDKQFRYIKRVQKLFLKSGRPVISVDAKNKEMIGAFYNKGRTWRKEAIEVNAHDFRQDALAVAIPYGIYDLTHNLGSVYVSTSYNTSEFAVEAIRSWWNDPHRPHFEQEDSLLVLCDAGGSNNCRFWLWKYELQCLADELGISIMICHYPTGASKYNPIEYRLFSQIFYQLGWTTFDFFAGYALLYPGSHHKNRFGCQSIPARQSLPQGPQDFRQTAQRD